MSTTIDANPMFFDNRIPCEWLSTEQAAQYLSISANALRICVHRGQIKAYKFGRRLRFRLEELRQALLRKGV
ncbi:MAG: helix-turn-helix domain-containing protein [Oligoflexia bacterium]|nr:helix-turn-helix domain-containing protein [Oligoflexia bacterium]